MRRVVLAAALLIFLLVFFLSSSWSSSLIGGGSGGGGVGAPAPISADRGSDAVVVATQGAPSLSPLPLSLDTYSQSDVLSAAVDGGGRRSRKKLPPFLLRRAKLPAERARVAWKCERRSVGAFDAESAQAEWPTCRMLDHDVTGKTFAYLLERVMCGAPDFAPSIALMLQQQQQQQQARHEQQSQQQQDRELPHVVHRPLRVLQVGANMGGNDNDPLVKVLRGGGGVAQAVLMEPVPWLFEKLHETYAAQAGMVTLVQAAMVASGAEEGAVRFVAPKRSLQRHGPWLHQMGGLSMPRRSEKRIERLKLRKEFAPITVAGMTLTTILANFAPWNPTKQQQHEDEEDFHVLPLPPDVFVIDAEGHDARLVHQVLDYVQMLDDAGRGQQGETVRVILYEHKHVPRVDNERLMKRLARMGYSVTVVFVDTIAVRTDARFWNGTDQQRQRWPACDVAFNVERS